MDPANMSDRLLVTVAPSIPPDLARALPQPDLCPGKIADEVVRACNAGANIAHLHVWDDSGRPTTELSAFRRTMALIRERCDIVIEGSTGGLSGLTPAERSVSLQTEIEMASLNPGSVNYDQGVYVNSPSDIRFWAEDMYRRQIKPNMAVFEIGMISNALELADQGWFAPPLLFTFVLGQKGALPATARNLLFLSETVPEGSIWCVAGHGGHDLRLSVMAMNMGGHVRAGFEDNPFSRPGELAKSNAQLIDRLVRIAHELGREIATPAEARAMLGLTARKGQCRD
jgi:3-keto-5-aminohexanoate cleavage enzyme